MPRTKVSKTGKRNREAAHREEQIREFDRTLDACLNSMERTAMDNIMQITGELYMLKQRTSTILLQMKMGDFLALDIERFGDWTASTNLLALGSTSSTTIANVTAASTTSSGMRLTKASNDEGYLTEDSNNGGGASIGSGGAYKTLSHLQQRGKTPGPLSSARARRPRRSQSASEDFVHGSALKPKPSTLMSSAAADRQSRSKLRTPMASNKKAFSADRSVRLLRQISPNSPPTAFYRWPKPGELVLSKCGSPVVSQVVADKYANVNIPTRNGLLSLRPKKLDDVNAGILENIDADTLSQIKTLKENLNFIVNMAEKHYK